VRATTRDMHSNIRKSQTLVGNRRGRLRRVFEKQLITFH